MKDPQDGYSFVYPFGWQEVAVKGQDVVYKDVIEPLESVSVSITQTDKADVTEFGSPAEVCTLGWLEYDAKYPTTAAHVFLLFIKARGTPNEIRSPPGTSTADTRSGRPSGEAQPGHVVQVALTLAEKVLSPPKQEVKVLSFDQARPPPSISAALDPFLLSGVASRAVFLMVAMLPAQKEKDGRLYYTFEFASKASNYIRHALAIVTVGNGKLAPSCCLSACASYQRLISHITSYSCQRCNLQGYTSGLGKNPFTRLNECAAWPSGA